MEIDRSEPGSIGFVLDDGDSEKLSRIIRVELPNWLKRFSTKNRGYRSEGKYGLGVKAEFVEINRKTGKLYQGIWLGDSAAFEHESATQVLEDIIGHCFLALDYLHQGEQL